MTSKLHKAAKSAVIAWCEKNGRKVKEVRHIHPRTYVIGRSRASCLVISRPWQDSEPQLKYHDRTYPLEIVFRFDQSLEAGMWCASAYVITDGCCETVAVPFDI